jgi:hypothetical protein
MPNYSANYDSPEEIKAMAAQLEPGSFYSPACASASYRAGTSTVPKD